MSAADIVKSTEKQLMKPNNLRLLKGSRAIPILGTAVGVGFLLMDLKSGKFGSAAFDAASMVPGMGTAATVGQFAGMDQKLDKSIDKSIKDNKKDGKNQKSQVMSGDVAKSSKPFNHKVEKGAEQKKQEMQANGQDVARGFAKMLGFDTDSKAKSKDADLEK